jgi:hypothetical protein
MLVDPDGLLLSGILITVLAFALGWMCGRLGEWCGERKPDPLIEARIAAMDAALDRYLDEPDAPGVASGGAPVTGEQR